MQHFPGYLLTIREDKIVTHGGPFHRQLERALCDDLEVKFIRLFTNGTVALMTQQQALRINGEVVTTPHSFVATAHFLLCNSIRPSSLRSIGTA